MKIMKKETVAVASAKVNPAETYLQDYLDKPQREVSKKYGVIFCFTQSSFDERKQKGVTYVNLEYGCCCPKNNRKSYLEERQEVYLEAIAKDLKENGKDAIIAREINNHECYYSLDLTPCFEALNDYDITINEINTVFNKNFNYYVNEKL